MDPITLGIIASSAKFVKDMKKSDELKEQAMKKSVRACNHIADAAMEKNIAEEKMNKEILRLINRKKGILMSSMKSFLELYNRIIKIHFTESDGIRELDDFKPVLLEQAIQSIALETKGVNAPGLTKNVVKGFLVGGLLGAISSSIVDDAQYKLDIARQQLKQAELIAEKTRVEELSYRGVTERVSRMTDTLTKCNALFVKAIGESNIIIEKNGTDKSLYTEDEKKTLAGCINLAGAIKDILDASIIDQQGEITEKSLQAIQQSENIISEVQFLLSDI